MNQSETSLHRQAAVIGWAGSTNSNSVTKELASRFVCTFSPTQLQVIQDIGWWQTSMNNIEKWYFCRITKLKVTTDYFTHIFSIFCHSACAVEAKSGWLPCNVNRRNDEHRWRTLWREINEIIVISINVTSLDNIDCIPESKDLPLFAFPVFWALCVDVATS